MTTFCRMALRHNQVRERKQPLYKWLRCTVDRVDIICDVVFVDKYILFLN